jgi:hypothetical protein
VTTSADAIPAHMTAEVNIRNGRRWSRFIEKST